MSNNTNNNDDVQQPDPQPQQQQQRVKETREQRLNKQEQNKPLESLADTAIHNDLVDNPQPYNENKDAVLDAATEPQKPIQKKPSQMTAKELTQYLGRKSVYRFLIVNDDGTYSYEEHKRKTVSNDILETISEIGLIAYNFTNLSKQMETDKKSMYHGTFYYQYKDKKLYTQTQAMDYYFKTIIFYSFRIPFEKQNKFATEDDKEQWDELDAYSTRTIGRVSFELSNFSWTNFQQS